MRISILWGNIVVGVLLMAATAMSVGAQLRTGGQVVDVLDGKTVVVAVPTGRLTVELQGIDVPESGQALHDVVKGHVRTLLIGKSVELQTKGFTREKITGKLIVGGVDVSQQLLRDGAAWHLAIEASGQSQDEFGNYAESETLARNEKRGVWSIADLEPAWEYRARKQQADSSRPSTAAADVPVEAKAVAKRKGYWSDKNPWLKDPGGVIHGYNEATKTGFLGTTALGVYDMVSKKTVEKATIAFTFYYTETGGKGRDGYFLVTVQCALNDPLFAKSGRITIHADGKNFVVNRLRRDVETEGLAPMERLTYQVDKATIHKLTNGGDAYIMLGGYNVRPMDGLSMLLHNILQLAS